MSVEIHNVMIFRKCETCGTQCCATCYVLFHNWSGGGGCDPTHNFQNLDEIHKNNPDLIAKFKLPKPRWDVRYSA